MDLLILEDEVEYQAVLWRDERVVELMVRVARAARGGMTGRFSYACAYSSADKSTGLRNRGSWVQIPLGALKNR